MGKFNDTKQKSVPTEINNMGEKAYALSDKEKLAALVLTTFIDDSYYLTKGEILSSINELSSKVGKEFCAKLALYARHTANMRSSSHYLSSCVLKDNNSLVSPWLENFLFKSINRPDDMAEILSSYLKMNGLDCKSVKRIPNSMKRAFRRYLEKMNPYQIDKYKMNNREISLVDLVNIFHPVSQKSNEEAYRRLMKGESLDGTYDSKILEKEMSASCTSDMDEIEKSEAKHDAIESVLKSGMPIMNLLRNLCNIVKYASDLVDEAVKQLTDEKKILNSRLLPFRFASAYEKVLELKNDSESKIKFESDMSVADKVLNGIEKAMTIACQNVPELDGNCAILIDHSGSVRGDWGGNSLISAFSSVTTAKIGNLFASIMAFKQKDVYIGMFGDKLISPTFSRNMGLLEFNDKSYREGSSCGGATENGLYEFLRNAINEKKRIDNFIVFSDMEIGDGGEGGWDRTSRVKEHFHDLFKKFRKLNPNCLTVCVNINNRSGTSVFNPKLNILNVSGWSNAIFDMISMYQSGKVKTLVEEIEKIPLPSV